MQIKNSKYEAFNFRIKDQIITILKVVEGKFQSFRIIEGRFDFIHAQNDEIILMGISNIIGAHQRESLFSDNILKYPSLNQVLIGLSTPEKHLVRGTKQHSQKGCPGMYCNHPISEDMKTQEDSQLDFKIVVKMQVHTSKNTQDTSIIYKSILQDIIERKRDIIREEKEMLERTEKKQKKINNANSNQTQSKYHKREWSTLQDVMQMYQNLKIVHFYKKIQVCYNCWRSYKILDTLREQFQKKKEKEEKVKQLQISETVNTYQIISKIATKLNPRKKEQHQKIYKKRTLSVSVKGSNQQNTDIQQVEAEKKNHFLMKRKSSNEEAHYGLEKTIGKQKTQCFIEKANIDEVYLSNQTVKLCKILYGCSLLDKYQAEKDQKLEEKFIQCITPYGEQPQEELHNEKLNNFLQNIKALNPVSCQNKQLTGTDNKIKFVINDPKDGDCDADVNDLFLRKSKKKQQHQRGDLASSIIDKGSYGQQFLYNLKKTKTFHKSTII